MALYDEMTIKSKSSIIRYTHNSRFILGAKLCDGCSTILDYGTGSGNFLKVLSQRNPLAELTGYEPIDEMFINAQTNLKGFDKIKIVKTISGLKGFECIACFEVLEHLTEEDQVKMLRECKGMLKDGGRIIISVPIEIGVSSLIKNTIRWIAKQSHATKFIDVIKSFLGMRIERKAQDGYIYSHIGFRYSDLEGIFNDENLVIRKKNFSPVNWLGSVLNSQVFYILTQEEIKIIGLPR